MAEMRARRLQFVAMTSPASPVPSFHPAATPATPVRADFSWDSRWRLCAAAILALTAILFFSRLGARALWSSEFRWAEIAREMRLSSNYFWPTINGRVYYDKPLGSYWLVLAAAEFTGRVDEAASRIPCAIAGLLGVAFLMLLVRRLYDQRTAIIAGFVLATSFSFVFFSRHASADVETVTGELAALALFLRYEDRRARWWVLGLWLIMAITSQTKGLLGFALPILVIGAYSCLRDGWRELAARLLHGPLGARVAWLVDRNRWLFNWQSVVAIPLGFAVYYLPFWMSQRMTGSHKGLEMVYHENVVRFFHPFDHRGPIYLYVYVIFALMAPWSVLLPAALVEAHDRRSAGVEPARSDRFALVYFWATFIFFTLSGSRRSYYILPILPAGAILVARVLATEARSRFGRGLLAAGYALIAIAVVAAAVGFLPPSWILPGLYANLPPAPDRIALAIFWIASVAGIAYALSGVTSSGLRPARIAISLGIIAYLSMAYVFIFAMPAAEAYRGEKPFGIAVMQRLSNRTDGLVLYKNLGPLFYLDPPPLPEFEKIDDLKKAIAEKNVRWVIARHRDVPKLDVPMTIVATEASFPWEGPDSYRNKVVLIRIGAAAAGGSN
jgi:4-amino-4-deoxy-L-arabinose transferase-like glycosyltransferase